MKGVLIIALLLSLTIVVSAQQSSCIKCHISSDRVPDTTVAAAYLGADIHEQNGIGCEQCHGGDPTKGFAEDDQDLAMDPAKGFKPPPNKLDIPNFCARCHSDIEYMKKYNPALSTDQLTLYKTSIHGKLLFEKKDDKVAVCVDCHGIHGILSASDSRSKVNHQNVPGTCGACHSKADYMAGYSYRGNPIPTDQYDKYSRSVHGVLVLQKGDQSAPACNGCHGNHGATPPSLVSVTAACGECHATNRDYFNSSPHSEPFKDLDRPDCEQCHGNHLIMATSDTLIGTTNGALCIACHEAGSPGFEGASAMRMAIDSLREAILQADNITQEAEQKGVEGSRGRFDLGPAKDDLTRVRSVVHTFDPAQVTEITSSGIKIADGVHQKAKAALGDIRTRRIGLLVTLLVVIFLAIILWRKIKQVDKNTDFTVRD
jgi:predicted CXXCH cytochrome family protein